MGVYVLHISVVISIVIRFKNSFHYAISICFASFCESPSVLFG